MPFLDPATWDTSIATKELYLRHTSWIKDAEKKLLKLTPNSWEEQIGWLEYTNQYQKSPKKTRKRERIDKNRKIQREEDSIILRGDNLPIVDSNKYNTDGKEATYIQLNHIVGNLPANKKVTEKNIKKADFELKTEIKTHFKNRDGSGFHSCQKQIQQMANR